MKLFVYAFMVCSLSFVIGHNMYAQEPIDYGSNHGNYVTINDTDVYYEVYGKGQPTLLLHGGLGSISDFAKVIPELSEQFKIIALDSPGHGRSQHIDTLSYAILSDYLVAFLDKLNLEKVNIIGYSDGAIVGMLVTHKALDKIDKLVFGAGALNPKASTPEGLDLLRTLRPEMLPEAFAIAYKNKSPNPELWEDFVMASKKMWLDEVWIPSEILPHINSEVLILSGDRDPFIPLHHTIAIYNQLVNGELCVVPKLQHDLFNYPESVNPVLIRFLSDD